jgi:outer membrane protein TolC
MNGCYNILLLAAVLLIGCTGIRTPDEQAARRDLTRVTEAYRPAGHRPTLPTLTTNSRLSDYLQYAILKQPQVEVAYYDWAGSVNRITVERSLPDPRLTFQSDIANIVMSLMPGLMMDFPGPGKLKGAAAVATAESQSKYFAFESSVLQTAFAFKKAYFELQFLDAKVAVNKQTLELARDLERIARTQNEVGKVTLQDVLRAQIEQEQLATEITNLEDSRNPLLAQFKASLGLKSHDDAPPVPHKFESTPLEVTWDKLFTTVLARNPRLMAMEAEVRRAEASLRLAYKARVPDFSLGVEADVKAAPTMFRPQAAISLPIWRDKIAAQIAAAQAQKRAADARLSAEQIALAVEFAERSFMLRESERNLDLLEERLLPKAQNSLSIARTGYTSARATFIDLIDAERTLLEFQLREIEAKTQRELALAELSLLILGEPPSGVPVLSQAKTMEALPRKNKAPR